MVKFKSLAQFPLDQLSHPVVPSLVLLLCLFAVSLKWLTVSSLSPYNLHLLIWWVLSFFALIELVLLVLFCAPNRSDSVSLLRFSFHNHVQVSSCAILPVCCLKLLLFFSPYLFCCFSVCLYVINAVLFFYRYN